MISIFVQPGLAVKKYPKNSTNKNKTYFFVQLFLKISRFKKSKKLPKNSLKKFLYDRNKKKFGKIQFFSKLMHVKIFRLWV